MRTKFILLFVLCFSFCIAQKSKSPDWSTITDSLGQNLFDSTANYLLIAFTPFNTEMKNEIDAWLDHMNDSTQYPSGVVLYYETRRHKLLYTAFKNSETDQWTVEKQRRKRKNREPQCYNFNLTDSEF